MRSLTNNPAAAAHSPIISGQGADPAAALPASRRVGPLALLSLCLCLAAAALWARSYWRTDVAWTMARGHVVGVNSETGRLLLSWSGGWPPDARAGRRQVLGNDVALWQQVKRLFVFRAGDAGGGVWAVQVPHWSLAAAASIPALLWLRRRRAERLRRTAGTCRRCGYDLRATRDRCPECGEPVPPEAS